MAESNSLFFVELERLDKVDLESRSPEFASRFGPDVNCV